MCDVYVIVINEYVLIWEFIFFLWLGYWFVRDNIYKLKLLLIKILEIKRKVIYIRVWFYYFWNFRDILFFVY